MVLFELQIQPARLRYAGTYFQADADLKFFFLPWLLPHDPKRYAANEARETPALQLFAGIPTFPGFRKLALRNVPPIFLRSICSDSWRPATLGNS